MRARHAELLGQLLLAELGTRRHVLPADAVAQSLDDVGDRGRAAASAATAGAARARPRRRLEGDHPA
jgi:hypothetical protein